MPLRPLHAPDTAHWLPARRSRSDPAEVASYVCFGPDEARLSDLVRVAGTRWAIAEVIEGAKGEVGLDHYEVRRWPGWYRHVTLALLARAFLAVTRAQVTTPAPPLPPHPPARGSLGAESGAVSQPTSAPTRAGEPGRVLAATRPRVVLSVAESRRLRGGPLWAARHVAAEAVLAWSDWRRRHQAQAKLSHYKRRGAILVDLQL